MALRKREKSVLLEILTGSVDDALAAQAGRADRIELNSSVFLGGLTPTLGTLIEVKKALTIPVMCMVRPRGGGFCYTDNEMKAMERDTELAVSHGADGIVFGILKGNGHIDPARCRRLIRRIGTRTIVFHRAFDVTPDPFRALEQLVDLGVHRVMTSGQKDMAYKGVELIRRLIDHADGRVEILPAGGIDPFTVGDIVSRTGCTQIHMPLYKPVPDPSCAARRQIYFGGALRPPEDMFAMTDREGVRHVKNRLARLRGGK